MSDDWLGEGEQSRRTDRVLAIADEFSGGDVRNIRSVLAWMSRNLSREEDEEKALGIFASRSASEVIENGYSTGCHDDALVFVTLCRAAGIPARYQVWISRKDPENHGHCVAKLLLEGSWVILDQGKSVIYLDPEDTPFHRFFFFAGEGLDSWDVGIDSFASWQEISRRVAAN